MKQILLFGAGRSSTHFIDYILLHAYEYQWQLIIAESNIDLAESKIQGNPFAKAVSCQVEDPMQRRLLIGAADIVVSMLPAFLHILVAEDCVEMGVDMATASYVSEEMKQLHSSALVKRVSIMNELGLDPGLDHMSAMSIINEIKNKGGTVVSFESYCGGLVAASCDNNPWHYKISWNPRNIVLAGTGTATILEHGEMKFVPHSRLFREARLIEVPGSGVWGMYFNRDSLKYKELYDLHDIETMIRGTFRHPDFCAAWALIISLGLIDSTVQLKESSDLTYLSLTKAFLDNNKNSLKEALDQTIGYESQKKHFEMLEWLGLFSDSKLVTSDATPIDSLERLVTEKWKLAPGDADLVLMHHKIGYKYNDKILHCTSTLRQEGKDDVHTAMSELVGLPLAIYVKNKLNGLQVESGIHIPIKKYIYQPILAELADLGIHFTENWNHNE